MKKNLFLIVLVFLKGSLLFAQFLTTQSASELYHDLLKANQLGTILYIAAHPDDENTRLISYFENKLLARTAYLSLTRGDGGQNLVGTEIGAAIGVLRTQELLAAREIDRGEQFFTRAVDFGYSKSSVETLEKWGRDEVLGDMVWVIRNFRPDVLVTRFPPNNYAGHGHHEASAMLAELAFNAAGDPKAFPEQLQYVDVWQPKRLYFNTSSWWIKDLPEQARDNDNFIRVNVGAYNPLLGETYARIAARSRSQHKSQGFGTDVYYGLNIEYMEYVMGDKAHPEHGILDGVNTGWSRIGAEDVGAVMNKAIDSFNFSAPERTASDIVEALHLLKQKAPDPLRDYKIHELEGLLIRLTAMHIEAVADEYYYTPGAKATIKLHMQHQHEGEVILHNYALNDVFAGVDKNLPAGEYHTEEIIYNLPNDLKFSNHYWLDSAYSSLFVVPELKMIGKAQNDPALAVVASIDIAGYRLQTKVPVVHKTVDPVKAVLYRPVHIVPPLTFAFGENVVVSTNGGTKKLTLYIQHHDPDMEGTLELHLPKGWEARPEKVSIRPSAKGATDRMDFELTSTNDAKSGEVALSFTPAGTKVPWPDTWQLTEINYEHIPTQPYFIPARIPIQQFELNKGRVQRIGYVEGPGDEVATYLRTVGYEVDVLNADQIQSGQLDSYDAIITGIRAYNTREDLGYLQQRLNAYVESGGMLLTQYNTSHRLKSESFGPYPIKLGRERVTDELAKPRFLVPDHPALKEPNVLGMEDFEHWVQERGLYFAAEWDSALQPLIAWSDPGEPDRNGGLIVAPYGKGYYAYTGISFFRQLPAGVPGAYRLLANLLNLQAATNAKP